LPFYEFNQIYVHYVHNVYIKYISFGFFGIKYEVLWHFATSFKVINLMGAQFVHNNRIIGDIMGRILSSKRNDKGLLFEVELDYDEATLLQGHYDSVHMFTERIAEFETNISSRGKNSVTKYFLIPRHLRNTVNYNYPVNCQKIETNEKIIFIYVVDKTIQCMKS
jgi:hypothetical protein